MICFSYLLISAWLSIEFSIQLFALGILTKIDLGGIRTKLFSSPLHPYTKALLKTIPIVGVEREKLDVIQGTVPNLIYPPSGCRFHPRCPHRFEQCDSIIPKSIEIEPNYYIACHLYDPKYKDRTENL